MGRSVVEQGLVVEGGPGRTPGGEQPGIGVAGGYVHEIRRDLAFETGGEEGRPEGDPGPPAALARD